MGNVPAGSLFAGAQRISMRARVAVFIKAILAVALLVCIPLYIWTYGKRESSVNWTSTYSLISLFYIILADSLVPWMSEQGHRLLAELVRLYKRVWKKDDY